MPGTLKRQDSLTVIHKRHAIPLQKQRRLSARAIHSVSSDPGVGLKVKDCIPVVARMQDRRVRQLHTRVLSVVPSAQANDPVVESEEKRVRSWFKAEHAMTTAFFIAWAASVLLLAGSDIMSSLDLPATAAPVVALVLGTFGVACFSMVYAPATRTGSVHASKRQPKHASELRESPRNDGHDALWSRTVSWELQE